MIWNTVPKKDNSKGTTNSSIHIIADSSLSSFLERFRIIYLQCDNYFMLPSYTESWLDPVMLSTQHCLTLPTLPDLHLSSLVILQWKSCEENLVQLLKPHPGHELLLFLQSNTNKHIQLPIKNNQSLLRISTKYYKTVKFLSFMHPPPYIQCICLWVC